VAMKEHQALLLGRHIDIHPLMGANEHNILQQAARDSAIDARQLKWAAMQVQRMRVRAGAVECESIAQALAQNHGRI